MTEITDISKLAQISDTSYQDKNATRRQWIRGIDPNLRLDAGLSNKTTAVIRDIGSDNVYISHRGTKLSDFDDLSSDLSILVGAEKIDKRFLEAEAHLEKVRQKYKNANIILSSHSLGGTVARHLGNNNTDLKVHAFNPGSSIGHVRDTLKTPTEKRRSDITIYQTAGVDVLSVLGRLGHDKIVTVPKTRRSAHSLKNFTDHRP